MARYGSMSELVRVLKQETVEETQKFIVRIAKRAHSEVMSDPPPPSSFVRIVDGQIGAPEEAVKHDGRIVYQYSRIQEVVDFAIATLIDKSPELSGAYKNAHRLYLNGHPVADLSGYQSGDDVMITNTLPYARKIEVGAMKMRVSGTSKVYQQARRIVMGRFGNMVKVEFTFRAVIGGQAVNQAEAASTGKSWWLGHDGVARAASGVIESAIGKRHGKTAHNRSDVRYPCLVIREL
ncbi:MULTISPECIES: hypothetical protein [unclassified Rhizobium]|uniref:hypothetical protein n=1 Tax=unclassified Rhizobium TaxID=2613769 RepID=UPI000716296A|nr:MULTISPECIES: hypothetical protein [unclassified Rhizobium]KQS84127.1 hypothetical protein ASG50_30010 [Rhizobium sp. Leaf386]KQT03210.1 hypothetical protein ASG42_24695 [Rhizobium sp. Leaf391]KQU08395.1 hypothetical protein ASG68_22665 [Rhizobium sp. Leaf453]